MYPQIDQSAYQKWLDLSTDRRSPNHYELLGLRPYRVDADEVSFACQERVAKLRRAESRYGCDRDLGLLISELISAGDCLCDPQKKRAYDRDLQMKQMVSPSCSKDSDDSPLLPSKSRRETVASAVQRSFEAKNGVDECSPEEDRRRSAAPMAALALLCLPIIGGVTSTLRSGRTGSTQEEKETSIAADAERFVGASEITAPEITAPEIVPANEVALSSVNGEEPLPSRKVGWFDGLVEKGFPESSRVATTLKTAGQPPENRAFGEQEADEQKVADLVPMTPQPELSRSGELAVGEASIPLPPASDVAVIEDQARPAAPGSKPVEDSVSLKKEDKPLIDIGSYNDPTESVDASTAARIEIIRGSIPQATAVVGDHLTDEEKALFAERLISIMDENWSGIDELEDLRKKYEFLREQSSDPRLDFAIGLILEKNHKYDDALKFYERSRHARPAIPYFPAWRRGILLRLARKGPGDFANAMSDTVAYVEGLVELQRSQEPGEDRYSKLLAHDIHSIGQIFGFLGQLQRPQTRRFSLNARIEEQEVVARLYGLPNSQSLIRKFELGKEDLINSFLAEEGYEKALDELRKEDAAAKYQGETRSISRIGKSTRPLYHWWWWSPRTLVPYTNPPLPPHYRSDHRREKYSETEQYVQHEAKYRKPHRWSEKVTTYFLKNFETEKRRLTATFPSHTPAERWSFATDDDNAEEKGGDLVDI